MSQFKVAKNQQKKAIKKGYKSHNNFKRSMLNVNVKLLFGIKIQFIFLKNKYIFKPKLDTNFISEQPCFLAVLALFKKNPY